MPRGVRRPGSAGCPPAHKRWMPSIREKRTSFAARATPSGSGGQATRARDWRTGAERPPRRGGRGKPRKTPATSPRRLDLQDVAQPHERECGAAHGDADGSGEEFGIRELGKDFHGVLLRVGTQAFQQPKMRARERQKGPPAMNCGEVMACDFRPYSH